MKVAKIPLVVIACCLTATLAGLVVGFELSAGQASKVDGTKSGWTAEELLNTPSDNIAVPQSVDLWSLGSGIEESSVTYLGEDRGFTLWAARDAAGKLCLVAVASPVEASAASACGPISDFVAGSPINLRYDSDGSVVEAYLMARGEGALIHEGATFISPNLLVVDPDLDASQRASLGETLGISSFLFPELERNHLR